jgi:protein O-GlcNAc transferase
MPGERGGSGVSRLVRGHWPSWWARLGVAILTAIGLAGCGSAAYLVPAGGTPVSRGYQQAAEIRWASIQTDLSRAAYDEEQAIVRDPLWAVPHARLAQILLASGQPAAALGQARRALELSPASELYANNVGELALQVGEWRVADEAFRHALFLHPADWVAATGLASLEIRHHAWLRASRLLRLALAWGGPQGVIYDTWGQYYYAIGNYTEAVAYYADAQSSNSSWWVPYYHLAQVELKMGQTEDAYHNLSQALNLGPTEGQVWTLYRRVGQQISAEKAAAGP